MKKSLMLIILFALVLGLSSMVIAEVQPPAEVQFTPKMGKVSFDHTVHQQQTECITCHHTGEYASCRSCHGVVAEAPKAKNAFHSLCKDCHSKLKQGPTKCKECHIK